MIPPEAAAPQREALDLTAHSLDAWIVPPHTADQRKRGRGSDRRTEAMTQPLVDLVEQFCICQRKQRGRTEGGVTTYRWILKQFLEFVRARQGRLARAGDVAVPMIQAWMDDMAVTGLGPNTLRTRLATLSSFCNWLVKRQLLGANPVTQIDRPPRQTEMPAVPAPSIMDALVEAAKQRGRPRDLSIFLVMRYTGLRRGSVAALRIRNLDSTWGLRSVRVKGGKTQDLPLPAPVSQLLAAYVERVLGRECERVTADTPLFWSTWGKRSVGKTREPMTGKNIWRLCKVYGRIIGCPELKPHDIRHGVAHEVLEQGHDLEGVRALLGHARIDTTQIYTRIRPPQLKRTVAFYEADAARMLTS
jgi:integrase/recombinase XerC